MVNFNINNFKANTNYVIEASAGTGKTYNIIEIIKKLIIEHKVDIKKILVVTFTEKAAEELKNRVRGSLREKGLDSLADDMEVYTIHSFCMQMIKEFGISSNLPYSLEVANNDVLEDFVEKYMRDNKKLSNCITSFIKNNIDISLESIKNYLIDLMNKYYLNKDYQEDISIITLENGQYIELYEYFNKKHSNNINSLNDLSNIFVDFDNYYTIIENSTQNSLVKLTEHISTTYDLNFDGRKIKTSSKFTDDESDAFNYFKNLKAIQKEINHMIAFTHIKDLYIAFQKEKEKQKIQTFNDMIRNVREAVISNDNFRRKLREKYNYAIIDEFQDTNQIQYDIFKNIFMCEEHNLIVVGDPKQSIYRFQGSDIHVYNKATKEISKNGEFCFLDTNYRSNKGIVDSCNEIFEDFFKDIKFNPSYCARTSYKIVDKNDNIEKPIYLVTSDDELSKYQYAYNICEIIIDLIKNKRICKFDSCRNIKFSDFTVLSKVRSEMDDIKMAFKKTGIPFIQCKDTTLFKGNECAHFIALLEAIDTVDFTGYNRKKFKKALYTSFFGKTLEEIRDDKYEKDNISEILLINRWKSFVQKRQWETLIDDILINSNLTNVLSGANNAQTLGVFKQLGSYCIELLSKKPSLSELIRTLKNNSKGDIDDENGAIIERSTDSDCVQIMTMHASKGLQTPIVIMLGGYNKNKTDLSTIYYNKDRKYLSSDIKKSEEEVIEENKRLFYVALTRAEQLLIFHDYASYNNKFVNELIEKLKTLPSVKKINSKRIDAEKVKKEVEMILNHNNDINSSDKVDQDKVLKEIISKKHTLTTYKHSYSSLSHKMEETEEERDKEGAELSGLSKYDKLGIQLDVDYDETKLIIPLSEDYPKGAKLGNAIHEVFENLNYDDYQTNLDDIIDSCFEKQNIVLSDDHKQETKNIVENTLNALIPLNSSKSITLKDVGDKNIKREIEFNFNLLNGKLKNYCNGFIDLMFKVDDKIYILDWKSDRLDISEGNLYANKTELKKHVDKRYSIQRTLYAYCLVSYLKDAYNITSEEAFNKYFGAVYYVFLRGCISKTGNGIYAHTWNSYSELEKSFNEIINKKVG